MTRVKICGITTYEDALLAAQAGADLLGFNFYPPSPRYLTPQAAGAITDRLRGELGAACPLLVGVFVNCTAHDVSHTMDVAGMNFAQFSGDESCEGLAALRGLAFKGIRPRDQAEAVEDARYYLSHAPSDERLPALLLDAYHKQLYGGTGEEASAEIVRAVQALTSRLLLAGGLTPQNVGARVRQFRPWGVDVASGVEGETPGRKDAARLRAFIAAVREADVEVSV